MAAKKAAAAPAVKNPVPKKGQKWESPTGEVFAVREFGLTRTGLRSAKLDGVSSSTGVKPRGRVVSAETIKSGWKHLEG